MKVNIKILLLVLLFFALISTNEEVKDNKSNYTNLSDEIVTDFSFSKFDIFDNFDNSYDAILNETNYIVNEFLIEATGFYINIDLVKNTNQLYYKETDTFEVLELNTKSKLFTFTDTSKEITLKIVDGSSEFIFNLIVNKKEISNIISKVDKDNFYAVDEFGKVIEEGYWKDSEFIIPSIGLDNNTTYINLFVFLTDEAGLIRFNGETILDNKIKLNILGNISVYTFEVVSLNNVVTIYSVRIFINPPDIDKTLEIEAEDFDLLDSSFNKITFDPFVYMYNILVSNEIEEIEFIANFNDLDFEINGTGVYEIKDQVTIVTISLKSSNLVTTDYTFVITKEIISSDFMINDVLIKMISKSGKKEVLELFTEDFDPLVKNYGPYTIKNEVLNLNVTFNCLNYDNIEYLNITNLKTGLNIVNVVITIGEVEVIYYIYLEKEPLEFCVIEELEDIKLNVVDSNIHLKLTKQKPIDVDYQKLIKSDSLFKVKILSNINYDTREVLLEVSDGFTYEYVIVYLEYENILYDYYYKFHTLNLISIGMLGFILFTIIFIKGKKTYKIPSGKRRLKK